MPNTIRFKCPRCRHLQITDKEEVQCERCGTVIKIKWKPKTKE